MTDREAFEAWWSDDVANWDKRDVAWFAWQAALASERAKQAEPVAWLHTNEYGGEGMLSFGPRKGEYQRSVPLYAAPPADQEKRERVELLVARLEGWPTASQYMSSNDVYIELEKQRREAAKLLKEAYL